MVCPLHLWYEQYDDMYCVSLRIMHDVPPELVVCQNHVNEHPWRTLLSV